MVEYTEYFFEEIKSIYVFLLLYKIRGDNLNK